MALLETLTDNFDDNSLDTGKWSTDTAGGGTVAEQNQRLEIAGPNFNDYATVNGVVAHDLTASQCFARITRAASTYVTFGVTDPGGDQYYIQVSAGGSGSIALKRNIGGTETQISTNVAYSATTHAWWRVRESSGNIVGETAPSTAANPPGSGEWTQLQDASEAVHASFDKTAVKAYMSHYSGAGGGLATYFDGYNTATSGGAATEHESVARGVARGIARGVAT